MPRMGIRATSSTDMPALDGRNRPPAGATTLRERKSLPNGGVPPQRPPSSTRRAAPTATDGEGLLPSTPPEGPTASLAEADIGDKRPDPACQAAWTSEGREAAAAAAVRSAVTGKLKL